MVAIVKENKLGTTVLCLSMPARLAYVHYNSFPWLAQFSSYFLLTIRWKYRKLARQVDYLHIQ